MAYLVTGTFTVLFLGFVVWFSFRLARSLGTTEERLKQNEKLNEATKRKNRRNARLSRQSGWLDKLRKKARKR